MGWVKTGEFGGYRLAQHDGPGFPKQVYGYGGLVGDVIGVDLGTGGGGDAGDVIDVFDADWHAVQGSGRGTALQFCLALLSVGQHSLTIDPDPGIKTGFQNVHSL